MLCGPHRPLGMDWVLKKHLGRETVVLDMPRITQLMSCSF